MVSIVQEQLVAILNERHADLKASLVDILCLEAEGSNCNGRKIRFASCSRPLVCALSTEDSLIVLKVVVLS